MFVTAIYIKYVVHNSCANHSALTKAEIILFHMALVECWDQRSLSFAALFLVIYAALLANRSVAASRVIHHQMLSAVLRAPLTFFETTPAGRILNRFSRDIETVDTRLPELMESWLLSAFNVLATVTILVYSMAYFLVIAIPLAILYYFAQVAVFTGALTILSV